MNKVGIYLHFPYCRKKCLYCDFYSSANPAGMRSYELALARHLAAFRETLSPFLVDTVYFGGGTPSLCSPQGLAEIFRSLKENFSVAPDSEITCEMNPESATEKILSTAARCGVNRISLGMQSALPEELSTIGRIHTFEDVARAVKEAKKAGISRISLDLMTGLPGQRKGDLADSLRWVIAQQVEHISLYSLIIEEGTPFFELHERGELLLPDEETERQIFEEACELLRKAGYERYEISNFAKPGRACRHNIRYWKREDYLGLGVAAVSQFADQRIKNGEDLESYLHNLEAGMLPEQEIERVCAEDLCFETVMLALRMAQGLEYAAFETEFGPAAAALARELAARWEIQGFASPDPARLRLTPAGFDVQNALLVEFWDALDELETKKEKR